MRRKIVGAVMAVVLGIVGAMASSQPAQAGYHGEYIGLHWAWGATYPQYDGDGGCYTGYLCVWTATFLNGPGIGFWDDAGYWGDPEVPRLPDGGTLVSRGQSFVNYAYPGGYDTVMLYWGGLALCLDPGSAVAQGWETLPIYGHVWTQHC